MGCEIHIKFLILLVIITIVIVESVPFDAKELKNNRHCKTLCGQCGCIGFYCGEECICECNDDNTDNLECIETIQNNAKILKVPFEILIQGPSKNRLLKNALQFNQDQQKCTKKDNRNKRSTIIIYNPKNHNIHNNFWSADKLKSIQKRSIGNESPWYDNADSSIVKPAPIPGLMSHIDELDIEPESDALYSSSSNLLPKLKSGFLGLKELLANRKSTNKEDLYASNEHFKSLFGDDDESFFGFGEDKRPKKLNLDFDRLNSKLLKLKSLDLDLGGSKIHDVLTNIKSKADDLFKSERSQATLDKAKLFLEKLHEDSIFSNKKDPQDPIAFLFKD